ncbi:hypothetical protein I545_6901 [Mycobacterium kansasii 662]|uniref:Uncharacterized protein n=1 Tax=Mycobacterium kansasii 662 TaxID=1299326 RepID=X7XR13_MYCKA|nr:hypothetical protein I545_6901 [Mycobacterium kansasii 662]
MAVSGQGGLLVRVPPADTDKLLGGAHVSPMIMAAAKPADGFRVARRLCTQVTLRVDHA